VRTLRRVQHLGGNGSPYATTAPGDRPDLIALQGDQRRDDQRQGTDRESCHLVDRALAAARRQDGERVTARNDRVNGPALGRAQAETEQRAGDRIWREARAGHAGEARGVPCATCQRYRHASVR
jgi:hypothetical protein